jgi:glutaredoxin/glutathione-dependent peroxiredoxin
MSVSIGDKIPLVTLKTMTAEGPKDITTGDIFAGKKVVLFGLPGAFTPTCSAKHLPGFIEKSAAFAEKGVDTVACISVNDAFVMGAWGKSQNARDSVLLLADGSADFAKAMGLDADFSAYGMGTRCQRFALVAEDGVVKRLNVEAPGQFEVSSADYVLNQL